MSEMVSRNYDLSIQIQLWDISSCPIYDSVQMFTELTALIMHIGAIHVTRFE